MQELMDCCDSNISALVVGPPGCGKTATIDAITREREMVGFTIIGSVREPSDFGGQPRIVAGHNFYELVPAKFVHMLNEADAAGKRTFMFIDEIYDAPRAVQSAMQRMIHERYVGDVAIPKRTWFCAAGNPAEYSTNGTELGAALANRFAHFEYVLQPQDWCMNFGGYWGIEPDPEKEGVQCTKEEWRAARNLIAGFIHARPNLLLDFPKDESKRSGAWGSPRTWTMASKAIARRIGNPDSAMNLVRACVGQGAALELIKYLKTADLPNPETLLAKPDDYKVPSRSDITFAVLSSLHTAVVGNMTNARYAALWKILGITEKAPGLKDVSSVWARNAAKIMPKGAPTPKEVMVFGKILQEAGIKFGA
jgi:hypothetical protein